MVSPHHVGIVGVEAAKLTRATEAAARAIIRRLLHPAGTVLVSGGCHLGGIDILAEEEYALLPDRAARPAPIIHLPTVHEWAKGYKPRNIKIAIDSDVLHNITVKAYPPGYTGMRFESCYHCLTTVHVKSGGCWTAKYMRSLGKPAYWHIL